MLMQRCVIIITLVILVIILHLVIILVILVTLIVILISILHFVILSLASAYMSSSSCSLSSYSSSSSFLIKMPPFSFLFLVECNFKKNYANLEKNDGGGVYDASCNAVKIFYYAVFFLQMLFSAVQMEVKQTSTNFLD